jgi:biopolymer transport protein ExbB/TolQ
MDLAHWRGARAAASETAPTERFRSLLLSRFVLLNAAGLLGLAVAWRQGLLERIWQADSSGISLAIVALFAWTMGMAFVRAGKLSQALDDLAAGRPAGKAEAYRAALRAGVDARVAADALKAKLIERLGFIRFASGAAVTLGLIGTVVGFIHALGGVDPAGASDAASIGPMVATLIEGMGIALYTTLVGSAAGIWLTLNHRLLATGAANLYTAIVEGVTCSTTTPGRSSATS